MTTDCTTDWTGKLCYGRRGTQYEHVAGTVMRGRRRCQLEGCGGTRIMVKWPDGHVRWPCSKGITEQESNALRIV